VDAESRSREPEIQNHELCDIFGTSKPSAPASSSSELPSSLWRIQMRFEEQQKVFLVSEGWPTF
jgi:hypothetical protein